MKGRKAKVIDFFTREVTEEVPRPQPVRHNPRMVSVFSERNFCTNRWADTKYSFPSGEVGQICGLLRDAFGFKEYDVDPFDPGEYNVHDWRSVIAVRAFPMSEIEPKGSDWIFHCGFFICVGGAWYFKPDKTGNFFRPDDPQARLFLKANPEIYPFEE